MRESKVKKKLAANQAALILTLHFTDANVFELASLMGFDCLWFDMEHHAHNMETAQNMIRAARVGKSDVVVRPAKGEFMRLGRMLEAGANGILYPRCDNAAEAAEVVKWSKFPPLGKRGVDGGNPDMPYCSMPLDKYVKLANEQTFVIVQVEEPDSLENVEEMLAVEGVDGVFLGPGDFSSIGGFPGQINHPKIEAAMERIAKAAKKTGKHWGRPAASPEDAQRYMAMGARLIAHSADLLLLKEGFENMQRTFGTIGFGFENQLAQPCATPTQTPANGAPHSATASSSPYAEAKK
jgi:4-hydroxy-2-oxoheptanedioate aldolase